MSNVWWILRREVGSFLRTPFGYIVIAAVLLIDGLLFNAWAVGGGMQRTSSEVLEIFFYCTSGTTLLGSIFIAMRTVAEERQTGTLVLLMTSPIKDWQLVLGKFLSAMTLVAAMTLLTAYMPALVMLHGKIAWGHIAAGYFGLMLLGGATIAIGLLCSALSPNQLIAAILGAGVVTIFLLMWLLSQIASPPIESLLAYLSLHNKHFKPFMQGIISVQDIVFYISLTYVALLCAVRVLEARRWQ
jgi:ABC-2 type transport system permease protein